MEEEFMKEEEDRDVERIDKLKVQLHEAVQA